jgi:hypothetical protein
MVFERLPLNKLLSAIVGAVLTTALGCESYRAAYIDVTLEREIENLGFTPTPGALNYAPGSIVTTETDPRKGDFGLVCSWNQVLSAAPESQTLLPTRALEGQLVKQYGQLNFLSGIKQDALLQQVHVARLVTLTVPLAAINVGSKDVSCESAIMQIRNKTSSKIFAVVGALRAELVYTLTPKEPNDAPKIFRQLSGYRPNESFSITIQGDDILVVQMVQLGIKVLLD